MSEQDPESPMHEQNPEQNNPAGANSPAARNEQRPAEIHFPIPEQEHEDTHSSNVERTAEEQPAPVNTGEDPENGSNAGGRSEDEWERAADDEIARQPEGTENPEAPADNVTEIKDNEEIGKDKERQEISEDSTDHDTRQDEPAEASGGTAEKMIDGPKSDEHEPHAAQPEEPSREFPGETRGESPSEEATIAGEGKTSEQVEPGSPAEPLPNEAPEVAEKPEEIDETYSAGNIQGPVEVAPGFDEHQDITSDGEQLPPDIDDVNPEEPALQEQGDEPATYQETPEGVREDSHEEISEPAAAVGEETSGAMGDEPTAAESGTDISADNSEDAGPEGGEQTVPMPDSPVLDGEAESAEAEIPGDDIRKIPGMVVPPAVVSSVPALPGMTEASGDDKEHPDAESQDNSGINQESVSEVPAPMSEIPEESISEEPARIEDEAGIPEETREEPVEGVPSEESGGESEADGEPVETGSEISDEESNAVEETAESVDSPERPAEEPENRTLEGLDEIVSGEETGGEEEPEVREEVVDDLAHIIESIIFASDEPLSVATIKSVLDAAHTFGRVNPDMITSRIAAVNAKYDADGTGFHIVEIANGYQYATRKENAQWVSYLFKERSKRRLSNSALETVAIIAYKQPITKPEIESIRGVNVDYVLHNLLEKELVTVTGRAETVGRPLLYGTTQKFLKVFALKSLDDLPKLREIDEIIKEIKSKGAEESIQLEITALGDSSPAEPATGADNDAGGSSENGAE